MHTVAAAGLGYMVYTKYNNVLYDAADSGVCGVTVGGSIKATGCREKDDSYQYDPAAIAAGTAVWADATYPMKNITVKAETIEAHATNTCAAYANGFAYRVDIGGRAQGSDWNYDFVNCSVDVDTIFSSSVSNTSFATGFIYHGYGTFENCTVNAKTIKSASSNKHAGTVGFNYMFLPITSYYAGESAGNLEKCSVTAESLVANGSESAEVYGLCAAVFGKQYYQVEGNVENCTVKIGDIDISASACNSALLISDNYDCKISENNVTISESVARALGLVFDVTQASDSTETGTYLLYTANEDSGRGRATAETSSDWESGNTVTLLSNGGTVSSVNDIFCRYDNGNTENGTLWKIASSIQYYTVSYDLNGGTVENENDCAAKTVASGEAIIVAAAPTKDDYNFNGWSDGTTTYQPGETLTVAGDVTLTAQWTKISSGDSFGETTYYTLSYESNGGTSYSDELYSSGATVKLDKVPSRENHTFTGWYADETLTERITEIKMNSDKTVYAGWDRTGVPDWLNGEDHFAYVIGYGDGLVRPTDSISRAEVATIFFRLLKQEIRDQYLTTANNFTDVNEGDWYDMAVSTMTSLGILKGRTDTTFEPNAPITRAEFAAVCARFDTNRRNADSNFTDIGSHWAREEIERACALGWINGYEDGTFRPDQYITRAEAMTMINRVLNRMPETEGDLLPGMNTWPDNQPGAWYYLAVQEATNSHEFTHKGEIYESWTVLADDPDWMRYQD